MRSTKYIISIIICFLFVCFSAEEAIASVKSGKADQHPVSQTGSVIKGASSQNTDDIRGAEGILQSSIRISESNDPTFETFKNNKRDLISDLSIKQSSFSQCSCVSFLSDRKNKSRFYPLYITYLSIKI